MHVELKIAKINSVPVGYFSQTEISLILVITLTHPPTPGESNNSVNCCSRASWGLGNGRTQLRGTLDQFWSARVVWLRQRVEFEHQSTVIAAKLFAVDRGQSYNHCETHPTQPGQVYCTHEVTICSWWIIVHDEEQFQLGLVGTISQSVSLLTNLPVDLI